MRWIKELYYDFRAKIGKFRIKIYYNIYYPLVLKHRAKMVGKKDKIIVVFFAMNVAMWRYQGIYDLLSKDSRFKCHIVFIVPRSYAKGQQKEDLKLLRDYFDAKQIDYIDHEIDDQYGYDVKSRINPDIIFYPQPYNSIFLPNHEYQNFTTKLLCYMPYSVNVIVGSSWLFDLEFHNLAWKIYCPLMTEKKSAEAIARNKGRNWLVSGYSNLDRYLCDESEDVWKIKDRSVKRLIWAPHFTMSQVTWLKPRSNFLWMSQLMLRIALYFKDQLQIAFKPHPRLKSELYRHPNWGKDKTDNYYKQWESMDNTQLETGDFVDLFKTSDAMIHDSCSFTAEYLYVNKPVAFVTSDIESLKTDHNEFGRSALDQHYIVGNEEQVMLFVEQVVLGGKDTKKEERTCFYEKVLKPGVSGTTSQFIVEDIKKSLGIKEK